MSRFRLPLLLIAILAGLVVVLAAAFYGASRLAWFERQASSQLSEILGWPVQVGDLAVGYFPLPWIEMERLVIAGNEAGDAASLAEITKLRATLPWRTVLGRGGHITRLELDGPRIALEVGADERGNWEPFVERLVTLAGDGPSAWSIGSLKVEQGTLVYGRAGEAPAFTLTGLGLTAEDLRPASAFPMDLRVAGQAGQRTFHATATGRAMLDPDADRYAADELVLAGWIGGDDLPLAGVNWAGEVESLRADLAAGTALVRGASLEALGAQADAEVEIANLNGTPAVTVEFKTNEFSPRMVGFGVNRPLPETTDPNVLSRLQLAARAQWGPEVLAMEFLQGRLDDTNFTGALRVPADGRVPDLQLQLDTIDLDRYLPPEDPAAPTTPQSAAQELLGGLESIDLQAEITIGEARIVGATARGMKVTLTPTGEAGTP